jgi:hypothetical protein
MKNDTDNEINIIAYCVPSPPDELDDPERFEIHRTWDGKIYVVDTYEPSWKTLNSAIGFIKFIVAVLLLLFCLSIVIC